MASPLIGPLVPKPCANLEAHAKMIRIRRLSDRISELLAAPQNYEVSVELQKLKAERKLIFETLEPLRIIHSNPNDNFRSKLCASSGT